MAGEIVTPLATPGDYTAHYGEAADLLWQHYLGCRSWEASAAAPTRHRRSNGPHQGVRALRGRGDGVRGPVRPRGGTCGDDLFDAVDMAAAVA